MKYIILVVLLFYNFTIIDDSYAKVYKKNIRNKSIYQKKMYKQPRVVKKSDRKYKIMNKAQKRRIINKPPNDSNIKAQNVSKNIEDNIRFDRNDNVKISLLEDTESVKKITNNFNPDNPINNAPIDLSDKKQDKVEDKTEDKIDFDSKQFTQEEQEIMNYITDRDIDKIKDNKNIIFDNRKISLFLLMTANDLRGTMYNQAGIQMLEILLEKYRTDYMILISLGLSYFENGEFYKSREILQDALSRINQYANKNVADQVKQILKRIKDSIANINGNFSIGYGYDDNPLYLSSSKMISIFNLQMQNAPIHSDFLMNTTGTLNYNYYFNDNIGNIGYFSGNLNLYNKTGTRNMMIISAGDGLSFKYGKFRIDILGNYNRLWFGGNSISGNDYFLQSYGASTQISYIINKYLKASIFFNYYRKDFSLLPERNSNLFSTGISLAFNPFYYTFINVSVGSNSEFATLRAYSNDTLFTSVMINQIINKYFSVTASLFYAHSNYKSIDPIVLVLRNEDSLMFQASLNYHLTENFIWSLVYKRIQNISNATLYNYNRNYYYVSFGFRF